ncbi:MAG: DUF1963 domain-containing protein [Anaerolineales bacterium]|nr:DUF1963 domain-containing protein [Anaerolineales bacterium]MBX3036793.1 DUF1963 domain-containing protein [Anaerolineales bacterium]
MLNDKLELPKELEPFRQNIESTIKPFIKINAKRNDKLSLLQSKFGGFPYLPKNFQYPKDMENQPMFLLAQLNFSEIPTLDTFPSHGLLQFYISGNETSAYGINFDNLSEQKNFRIQFFSEVESDESKLITNFDFLPNFEYTPLVHKSYSLIFSVLTEPIPTCDTDFHSKVFEEENVLSHENEDKIFEIYTDLFRSEGHKIGGYPFFTQNDPRDSLISYEDQILLFQMDSDEKAGINWGDSGVSNFFIAKTDLQTLDFSRVSYNWDCL